MQSFRKNIPNILTLLNLSCGAMSVYLASSTETRIAAAYLILAAMVFDFFDGFAARLLRVSSATGKELDSLSDLVSFGLAPALLLMFYISDMPHMTSGSLFYLIPLLLIPALSALRLARFNLDPRQSTHFIGLPTPANALFLTSLFLMQNDMSGVKLFSFMESNAAFLTIISVAAALLLNSTLPLLSLKINKTDKSLTIVQLSIILISPILFAVFRFSAVPLIILIYLLLSVIFRKHLTKCKTEN